MLAQALCITVCLMVATECPSGLFRGNALVAVEHAGVLPCHARAVEGQRTAPMQNTPVRCLYFHIAYWFVVVLCCRREVGSNSQGPNQGPNPMPQLTWPLTADVAAQAPARTW